MQRLHLSEAEKRDWLRLIRSANIGPITFHNTLRYGTAAKAVEAIAVPGSPLDRRFHGSNDLIRQGATLVEKVDDILSVIAPQATRVIALRQRPGNRRRRAAKTISAEPIKNSPGCCQHAGADR